MSAVLLVVSVDSLLLERLNKFESYIFSEKSRKIRVLVNDSFKTIVKTILRTRLCPAFLKADTHEGFCSRSMVQGHTPVAKLLRVYQPFHGYTSSSGAEFPPRKMNAPQYLTC